MSDSWQLYICRACGLIYDEEQGDPDSGLAPGTRFEDIPDDWECPLCGVKKSDFELFARPNIAAQAKQGANVRHTTTEPGVVIIGAGIAGWSVAQQMRAINGETPITMITACNGDRYHKPELSVAMGRQLSTEKLVSASGLESASQLNVNLWPNTYVIGVSPALKQIRTTRGTLHYTKLVIAQGAKPFLSEALPASLCYRVNHLKDWHSLSAKLAGSTKHIAIIGSGMIGCELAEDFARSGHSIALVSRDAHPLNEILPEAASLQLEQSLSNEGVQFLADRDVQHINRNDDGTISLSFAHHDDLVVDVVVSAIGLSTDERIARLAALEFDHGIVVDPETLQTSDPDVYALGDCASIGGNIYRFVEPIIAQSKIIAQQISGLSDQRYSLTPPVIRLKTRSCPVVIHGFPVRNGRWQTLKDDDEEMIMEQRSDDELIATLSVPKKIA